MRENSRTGSGAPDSRAAPGHPAHLPTGHPGREVLLGHTTAFASQSDQRFSYILYVPTTYDHDGPEHPLLVEVHGTDRSAETLRLALVDHAEKNATVVMAPLFPAGIEDPNDVDNYKFIKFGSTSFDEILLAMVDEVTARWNVDGSRFALHGFSGGGQFAHRFLYLHPRRLAAVSIASPGRVTMPDPDQPWPRGVADLDETFGTSLDVPSLTQVHVHVVVGELDDDTAVWAMIDPSEDESCRLDRARALGQALQSLGCTVRLDVVAGVAHQHGPLLGHVIDFLDGCTTADSAVTKVR